MQLHQYAVIPIVFAIYLAVSPIIKALTTSLRSIPGPFLARFTRLWELCAVLRHEFATYNISLHEEYGPIVRLAPNRYSINDAEATRVLLGHHNALNKSDYYTAFGDPREGNVFTETDVRVHAKQRRPIAHLYSNNNLLSYEPFVDACNNILLKRLQEYSWNEKPIDVRELMQYYAFDVIGEISLGSRFGFMEDNGDKAGIITAIDDGLTHSAKFGLLPELHWVLVRARKMLGIEAGFMKIVNFILFHIQNRASGRTKSPDDRQDFLDKMLLLEQTGKASRFDTINACGSNIGAGSDTTAISLTAAIAYLSMNPDVLAKLREELDDAVSVGTASDPITFKEAQKLPYLHAVIQEALRIHPAVGAPLTRVIGPNGATLAGQYFPPGAEVGVNPWVIHNNKEIFGPDAAKFRPERWLTDNPEDRATMDRNFLAFGAGPRTCIGKNISLLEMYKVIPQIVRKFDFEIANDGKMVGGYTWKTFFFAKQQLQCVVKRRPSL